jgi:hypothetical protein
MSATYQAVPAVLHHGNATVAKPRDGSPKTYDRFPLPACCSLNANRYPLAGRSSLIANR